MLAVTTYLKMRDEAVAFYRKNPGSRPADFMPMLVEHNRLMGPKAPNLPVFSESTPSDGRTGSNVEGGLAPHNLPPGDGQVDGNPAKKNGNPSAF